MGKISECLYDILPEEVYSVEQYCSGDFRRNIIPYLNEEQQQDASTAERARIRLWHSFAEDAMAKQGFDRSKVKMLNVGVTRKNKVVVVLTT